MNKKISMWMLATIIFSTTTFGQNRPEEKLGWKLGSQSYTFRDTTFAVALDKIVSCNLKYVEGFVMQNLGGGIEGKMDYHMDANKRKEVLALLKKKGVKMVSFGVITPNTEADWRQLFTFLKGMGMQQFATEPAFEWIPLVSQLADEYKINVAIHDHPRPSIYWNPDTLIKYTAGYSKRLGACADIGHWVRSGLDPVECLRKLNGRIFELHLKDLHQKPDSAFTAYLDSRSGRRTPGTPNQPPPANSPHDVPWGTGISNIDGVMQELKNQHFKGPIFAEYEYNWGKNTAEVAESAKNFRAKVKNLK